ncbi:Hsp70 protein-domain-containing protein [Mycena filopes]|nr:Hsp70 protein-domain-containing protein [Mycena filopes]
MPNRAYYVGTFPRPILRSLARPLDDHPLVSQLQTSLTCQPSAQGSSTGPSSFWSTDWCKKLRRFKDLQASSIKLPQASSPAIAPNGALATPPRRSPISPPSKPAFNTVPNGGAAAARSSQRDLHAPPPHGFFLRCSARCRPCDAFRTFPHLIPLTPALDTAAAAAACQSRSGLHPPPPPRPRPHPRPRFRIGGASISLLHIRPSTRPRRARSVPAATLNLASAAHARHSPTPSPQAPARDAAALQLRAHLDRFFIRPATPLLPPPLRSSLPPRRLRSVPPPRAHQARHSHWRLPRRARHGWVCCAGVWQNDRVEIIANDQGNRTTPSYVSFSDNERLIGDAAKNQVAMNPVTIVFDAKRLIGRKFEDNEVQADMKHFPFTVFSKGGKPYIRVECRGEQKEFSPEEISSMVLLKMKETTES